MALNGVDSYLRDCSMIYLFLLVYTCMLFMLHCVCNTLMFRSSAWKVTVLSISYVATAGHGMTVFLAVNDRGSHRR